MRYWRINTDRSARDDVETCDIWYDEGMAFAGDFSGKKGKHINFFRKVRIGDFVLMHHNDWGIVGCGTICGNWDRIIHKGDDRLLYVKEVYEYRIRVDWDDRYDRRDDPIPVYGLIPYRPYFSEVSVDDFQKILRILKK